MTKKILVLMFGLVLCAEAAHAEIRIGLLNMRAALAGTEMAKAFSSKLEGEFKQQMLEVKALDEEGSKLAQRLKNDAAIMSDSEREKTAADYEEKAREFKYLKSKLDKAMGEKQKEFMEASRPKIEKVVNDLVAEEKLDLLLPIDVAMFAKPELDITQKVIDKLNKLK